MIEIVELETVYLIRERLSQITDNQIFCVSAGGYVEKTREFITQQDKKFTNSSITDSSHIYDGTSPKNFSSIIVGYGNAEEIGILSEYYAKVKHRELKHITSLTELRNVADEYEQYGSICVVCGSESVSSVQQVFIEVPFYGIITGADYNDILYLMNKNIILTRKQIQNVITVDRTDHTSNEILENDGVAYVPYNMATIKTITARSEKWVDIFALSGHGRDEMVWMTDGAFCIGNENAHNISNKENCKPYCAYTGVCYKDGIDIFPIKMLNFFDVFLNTCMIGKTTESTFNEKYSVLDNFISGNAVTVIATPFLSTAREGLIHLFAALALSGKHFSEIVFRLNRYFYNYGHYKNQFSLFGDPEHVWENSYSSVEYEYILGTDYEVYSLSADVPLITITISGDIVKQFLDMEYEISITNDKKQTIYSDVYWDERQKRTRVEIFTKGLLSKGVYFVRIIKNNENNRTQIRGLSRLSQIRELLYLNTKHQAQINEAIKLSEKIELEYYDRLLRLNNNGSTLYSKSRSLNKRISEIQKTLVLESRANILGMGVLPEEEYMGHGFREVSKQPISEKCDYCGGTLYKIVEENLITSMIRKHLFCPKCGTVFSCPMDLDVHMVIEGPESVKIGSHNTYTIKIHNYQQRDLFGQVTLCIVHGKRNHIEVFPDTNGVIIPPNQGIEIRFDMVIGMNCKQNCHWLSGVAILDNYLFTAKRNIYLV